MSNIFVFSNNASSLLASGIVPSDTIVTVQAGQGSLFPAISSGQIAAITLQDVSGDIEVVYCTGRTGDSLTVARAQEGTTALAFPSGSRVEQRVTSSTMASFLQKTGGDTMSGTTTLSGVINMGSGGSVQSGELAGTAIRSQPGDTSNQIVIPIGGPATEGGSVLLTTGNLTSHLPSGTALIVTGMIVVWSGLSSNIPAGWALCDGTNGTPDLRDRFIVGGGGSFAPTGSYAHVTDTASAGRPIIDPVTLSSSNFPAHTHPIDFFGGSSGFVMGAPGIAPGAVYFFGGRGAGVRNSVNTGQNGGGTTAPFTPTAEILPLHAHTVESPPYKAVFFIMKT
ncbi:MAG: phage tail protein [Acidobacteriota bacterium]|nr:phage tail protein [Acidobacteriota bacterium]